jgi:hypothetical protein
MELKTKLKFRVISGSFAVCRLSVADPVPQWATKGIFTSVTRTAEELSIVCAAEMFLSNINRKLPGLA